MDRAYKRKGDYNFQAGFVLKEYHDKLLSHLKSQPSGDKEIKALVEKAESLAREGYPYFDCMKFYLTDFHLWVGDRGIDWNQFLKSRGFIREDMSEVQKAQVYSRKVEELKVMGVEEIPSHNLNSFKSQLRYGIWTLPTESLFAPTDEVGSFFSNSKIAGIPFQSTPFDGNFNRSASSFTEHDFEHSQRTKIRYFFKAKALYQKYPPGSPENYAKFLSDFHIKPSEETKEVYDQYFLKRKGPLYNYLTELHDLENRVEELFQGIIERYPENKRLKDDLIKIFFLYAHEYEELPDPRYWKRDRGPNHKHSLLEENIDPRSEEILFQSITDKREGGGAIRSTLSDIGDNLPEGSTEVILTPQTTFPDQN